MAGKRWWERPQRTELWNGVFQGGGAKGVAYVGALRAVSSAARRPPRRRRRSRLVAIGVALVALPLAGFAYLQLGPEHVTEQKLLRLQEGALAAGGTKPNRYFLVASFHTDACDRPMPGVELVVESANQVGTEWSTAGVGYGEASPSTTNGRAADTTSGCLRYDEREWLKEPSRFALGITRLGQPSAQTRAAGRCWPPSTPPSTPCTSPPQEVRPARSPPSPGPTARTVPAMP
jgi:hypothetical protein